MMAPAQRRGFFASKHPKSNSPNSKQLLAQPASSSESKLSTAPVKMTMPKAPTRRPLLDLTAAEAAEISTYRVINGFAWVSGAPSAVGEIASQFDIEPELASLGMTARIGEIATIAGLGLIGAGVGYYYADEQITAEREKVIRLNKELFIMFNIAADKLQALKAIEAETADEKDADAGHKYEMQAEREADAQSLYDDALRDILLAILSSSERQSYQLQKSDQTQKSDQLHTSDDNVDEDFVRINAIIRKYSDHRQSNEGRYENSLWNILKNTESLSETSEMLKIFVGCNSTEAVTKHVKHKTENHVHNFKKNSQSFLKYLENAKDYFVEAKEKAVAFQAQIDKIKELLTQATACLDFEEMKKQNISDAQARARIKALQTAYAEIEKEFEKIKEQKPAHPQLTHQIKASATVMLVRHLKSTWNVGLNPLLKVADNNIEHGASRGTALLADSTPFIFGDKGTFRQFWRKLPNDTVVLNDKVPVEEQISIPLDFEARIHRHGTAPDKKTIAIESITAFIGLCTTAKSLYLASVALGATAMSATGIGFVVVGIALALTIISIACYYRTMKSQNDRTKLEKHLEEGRHAMITKLNTVDKNKAGNEVRSRPGFFGSCANDVKPPEHRQLSSSVSEPTRLVLV